MYCAVSAPPRCLVAPLRPSQCVSDHGPFFTSGFRVAIDFARSSRPEFEVFGLVAVKASPSISPESRAVRVGRLRRRVREHVTNGCRSRERLNLAAALRPDKDFGTFINHTRAPKKG